jgi:hypothetical protein
MENLYEDLGDSQPTLDLFLPDRLIESFRVKESQVSVAVGDRFVVRITRPFEHEPRGAFFFRDKNGVQALGFHDRGLPLGVVPAIRLIGKVSWLAGSEASFAA